MQTSAPPVGSIVQAEKPQLQGVIDRLRALGYRVVGPTVRDAAVVFDELESIEQLPIGYIDIQDAGRYRLEKSDEHGWFDHVVGPHSLKNYLFPPRDTILEGRREEGKWQMAAPENGEPPIAVIGARSCDLHALDVLDRVFLNKDYQDPYYAARRKELLIVAVNCGRAAATCFCHSMKTGPAVKHPTDLSLTETSSGFTIEIGSERGSEIIRAIDWSPCTMAEVREAEAIPQRLLEQMRQRESMTSENGDEEIPGRSLNVHGVRELLLKNLDHPHWDNVAERCLACANCTMVCPTCFCSSVEEVTDLSGDEFQRERVWDSCFTVEHSKMGHGAVRDTIKSRYRQWLTHKLATWHDQFDTSGCIGCGRCITWCPVGIDLTREVAAIRGETS